jgi:hypothetical protein
MDDLLLLVAVPNSSRLKLFVPDAFLVITATAPLADIEFAPTAIIVPVGKPDVLTDAFVVTDTVATVVVPARLLLPVPSMFVAVIVVARALVNSPFVAVTVVKSALPPRICAELRVVVPVRLAFEPLIVAPVTVDAVS